MSYAEIIVESETILSRTLDTGCSLPVICLFLQVSKVSIKSVHLVQPSLANGGMGMEK
jgi:hypothetical protein